MADLPLRPIAHATPTGRVAVYIGAAWQELPIDKAVQLRNQLNQSLGELLGTGIDLAAPGSDLTAVHSVEAKPVSDAPERFDVQLRQWRESIRSVPPTPELAAERAAELERRAVDDLKAERTAEIERRAMDELVAEAKS